MRSALPRPTAGAVFTTAACGALVVAVAAALSGPIAESAVAPLLPLGLAVFAAIVVLSISKPVIVATFAFGLLAVVKIEPAPVDVVFATLIVVTIATGWVKPRIPGTIAILLAVLVVLTIISAINAFDTSRALQYGAITLYLIVFAGWLTWLFTDKRATQLAIRAYIAVSAISSLLVIISLYGHVPGGNVFLYDEYRGEGLFKDPNVYSAFLVMAAAIVLEEIGRPRLLRLGRPALIALFVLIAGGIVVAFSRAAWLNLALAAATVVIVSAFRAGGLRVAMRATSALLVAGIAGLMLLWATGSLDFFQQRSQLESYDQDRFGAQNAAFSRMTENVFGHGPGQVEASLDISTHSLFARASFEQGLPGLVITMLLLVATLVYAIAFARRDGQLHGVGSAALLGSWIGLSANSLFIDTIHWRHMYVAAALIWTGYTLSERASSARPPVPIQRTTVH